MIALIVVAVGAVVAAVGTGVLAARSSRTPRIYFIAWTVGIFGLAVGLGAATLGDLAGYSALIFHAMELGAQLLAPLSLCLALVELGGRGLPARFAMRLAISALAIIAVVILGTDPLNPNVTFSTKWADPTLVYQLAPLAVLGLLAIFTMVTALATIVVTAVRSSRRQLSSDEARPVLILGVAAAALALPGLSWLTRKGLGFTLPVGDKDVFAASCTLAAGLIWYAAKTAGARDLSHVQAAPPAADGRSTQDWNDDYDQPAYGRQPRPSYRSHEAGDFDEFDEARSESRYPGLAALAAEPAESPPAAGWYGEPEAYGDADHYGDHGRYPDPAEQYLDSGVFPVDNRYGPAVPEPSDLAQDRYDDSAQFPVGGPDHGYAGDGPYRDSEPHPPLFGQITIYTLIEGCVDDFDRLTEWVVAQVRAREPDTLVYIVHAVPTAPMQRILYEVYRDRVAHQEHGRRGYVMTYETEQRPFVLATNVIELGLRQAKVSPLPSFSAISDLLSESGIDLTGITRSSGPAALPASEHAYGHPPYDPRYDETEYERPRYDQPHYEGPADQPPYDQAPYDQPPYDQPPYDQPPYDQSPYDQPPYDQPQYEGPYHGGWAEIRGEESRY
jgi:quinol monooxygenase YgiN